MITCNECRHNNREGFLFCEACGVNLKELYGVQRTTKLDHMPGDYSAKAIWGTARLGRDEPVFLHVRDADTPIRLEPAKRLVLGRNDPDSHRKPDVDLNPYGAVTNGVSRLHAAIERSDDTLIIVDMGSVNGTYLNGQRLTAHQPRVLRDGDVLRLGRLVLHTYFK